MSTNALSNIPKTALVRFVALLDDTEDENENEETTVEPGVTMLCAQAASLSKLVADQAAASEWEEEEEEEQAGEKSNETKKPQEIMIPVPIGTTENLKAIIKYLSARLASPQREIPAPLIGHVEDAVDDCDKAFLKSLPNLHRDVIPLASIAHYLNIPTLRDLMCAALANQLSHMNVEQMQETLGVKNDFSPGELNVLKKEFGLMEEHHWKTAPATTSASASSATATTTTTSAPAAASS